MKINEKEFNEALRAAFVTGANEGWRYISRDEAERAAMAKFPPPTKPRVISRVGKSENTIYFALVDGRLKFQYNSITTGRLPVFDVSETLQEKFESETPNFLMKDMDAVLSAHAELVQNPTEAR